MRVVVASVVAFSVGLAAGVKVTRHAHESPSSPGWAERVGGTRLRRSDLPVGGTLALLVAFVLRLAGKGRVAAVVASLGVGAAVGAVGTGLADPLPAADAA